MMSRVEKYGIARRCATSPSVALGWSSNGNHPMTPPPITEAQFAHLVALGIIRTDEEVLEADAREAAG